MARRKESGMDVIAAMPWPLGILTGILAFIVIRYGIGWYLSTSGGVLQGHSRQLFNGALTPVAWIALILCWLAAGVSFIKSRQRRLLLDEQTGLESLAAMSWREFEMLVGEAFRRRGYRIEETGLGGADGGIDLILRMDGRVELVQCKQWRTRQVKVPVVREMWGLGAHHHADGVKIVCVGEFTRDAKAFAVDKAIELINGAALLELVRESQPKTSAKRVEPVFASPSESANTVPACSKCNAGMVLRVSGKTGQSFWGCSTFPKCRGTQKNI
jgi:restriction system protein